MPTIFPRLLLALLLCAAPAAAQSFDRPNAGEGPTVIRMQVGVLDLDEINSAQQNFTVNVYFAARWQDDRLAHEGPGILVLDTDEAWAPDFQFVNQQKVFRTFPEELLVSPSGEVTYRQRVWGSFSQRLDLHEFPLDRHRFELQIMPVVTVFELGELEIVQDPALASTLAPGFSLPDWDIELWEALPTEYNPMQLEQGRPSFTFAFEARRHFGYFLFKLILPLLLIVMMSWIVFWIDPTEMGTQISVSITSMLTLIAYRFMAGSLLPTISYLTRLDLFILSATLMVFTTLLEAVLTGTLARRDRLATARRIDQVCRLAYPLMMVAIAVLTLLA